VLEGPWRLADRHRTRLFGTRWSTLGLSFPKIISAAMVQSRKNWRGDPAIWSVIDSAGLT
jgi:hypothetical protein